MIFTDRTEAGQMLAKSLDDYRDKDVVVLALPRGGVPVACEVARHLNAPLDLLLVRKLGVPSQPELAMGAVMDGAEPIVIRNEYIIRQAWVSGADFNAVCKRELEEVERRRQRYLAGRTPVDVTDRIALIVDDGVATGSTVRAAIQGLRRRHPARIVVAVPVAPPDVAAELRREADDVICLHEPPSLSAIGFYYRDFRQLNDDDVVALLEASSTTPETTEKGAS